MAQAQLKDKGVQECDVALERDGFLRSLVRELSGVLEDVVGLEEAAGFISVVGQHIGAQINADYKKALRMENLSAAQVATVLQDLKRRIQGDFYIIEQSNDKIVFGNRACPFAEKVKDRPSLCMMTSNVFGTIASENLGYAKVSLEQTIANGDAGCKVVVYISPNEEAQSAQGREYYKTSD